MITYFYDGETYHQGKMEFNNFGVCAVVNVENDWLNFRYQNYKYRNEKLLRDNIEERLRNSRMKNETA